ncbi:MAG: NAD(P)H-hydrate dehydratase [Gammaproteobacteria bacterium]
MNGSAQFVHDIAAIRAVERAQPSSELMARAGAAAFDVLRETWPGAQRIAVIAGPGNNGGDGRVLARLAQKAGLHVDIVDLGTQDGPPDCDVIVDALFGIGLSRAPDGAAKALIEAVNAHHAPVLALDVPSGLDADTGIAPGAIVVADATITFLAHKPGLFVGDGARCAGVITLARLGVPDDAFAAHTPIAQVIDSELAARLLGERARDAHKGAFGHVLVIGGNAGMAGAAGLAADAALRCGAGKVSIAVLPGMGACVAGTRPAAMVHEIADAEALARLLERATVVAIGPGLGTDAWARAMLEAAIACTKPLIADADALNLLAGTAYRRADWIITPHPGEAARLLKRPVADVQGDRFGTVRALAAAGGAVAVLKGAATLVASAEGRVHICNAGNPGMAAGGMGDVLTGVIAALRAQGLGALDAATAGVQLHAEAGDIAALEGERGLLPGDLLPLLRRRVNGLP